MLPVSYLLGRDDAPGFGLWAIAGTAIWLVGLLLEAVADAQKSAFKATPENRERFTTDGLWRSPHAPERTPTNASTAETSRARSVTSRQG